MSALGAREHREWVAMAHGRPIGRGNYVRWSSVNWMLEIAQMTAIFFCRESENNNGAWDYFLLIRVLVSNDDVHPFNPIRICIVIFEWNI